MDSVDQNLTEHSGEIGVGPLLMHDPDSEEDHSLSQHESDSILGDVHLPSEGSLIPHDDEKVDSLSSIEPIIDTSDKSALDPTKPDENCIFTEPVKFTDGQAVQLEDGSTAYILTRYKEGSQQIILEDGTTAYISHEPPSSMFNISEFVNSHLTFDNIPGISAEKHQLVDNEGRKIFECDHEGCGKVYATLHHLTYHQRSHMEKKPFVCGYEGCERTFATSYSLKSHIRVHTGEKPYKCTFSECEKAFKTSGDLQKHMRTHTGEKPFKCPFEGCSRSFTTSNIRKVHIRTHTGERPYKCDKCGRTFASATNHRNHIRIHTGEKPYVCNVDGCGKRFTEYSSLYKHNVVHTQNKPYQCASCGKTYRQTSTLAFHRRTAHGETDIIISAGDPDLQMTTLSLEQAAKGVVRMLDGSNRNLHLPKHVLIDTVQCSSLTNPAPSTSISAQPQIFILPDDGTELKMPSTTVSLPVLTTPLLATMSEATSTTTLNNS